MTEISIAINVDSRPGFLNGGEDGKTRSADFFTHGVKNKRKFFEGHDMEVVLYIDLIEQLPDTLWNELKDMSEKAEIDNVIVARHNETYCGERFLKWQCINFLHAMIQARGKYLVHFDGDMAAFRKQNSNVVSRFLSYLNKDFDFVSYPSPFSPGPLPPGKESDGMPNPYWWASTRFFICKREFIDYTEIVKCLRDGDYLQSRYGKTGWPWLEHVLGMMARGRVIYPKLEPEDHLIFSWSHYESGVLPKLNDMNYQDVLSYVVKTCGGMNHPCDVRASKL